MKRKERLGVGFIGSGFITRFHMRSWAGVRDADVRGVWSPNRQRAEEAAALARELRVGEARAFSSIEEMAAAARTINDPPNDVYGMQWGMGDYHGIGPLVGARRLRSQRDLTTTVLGHRARDDVRATEVHAEDVALSFPSGHDGREASESWPTPRQGAASTTSTTSTASTASTASTVSRAGRSQPRRARESK